MPDLKTLMRPYTDSDKAILLIILRALQNEGINTVFLLSERSEAEILKFHRMGSGSIPKLRIALKLKGLSFRND